MLQRTNAHTGINVDTKFVSLNSLINQFSFCFIIRLKHLPDSYGSIIRRKKQLLTMQINFQKEFRFLHSVGGD